jgi:hypothetical protein
MLLGRIMLVITVLIWTIYGAWLFVDPKGLSYIGLDFTHWSVTVEVVAMYGGFEFMIGVFTLLGLLNPRRYMRPAMALWALLYSGLVIGRIYGILVWDGSFAVDFGPDGLPGSYNPGAMFVLELPSAILFSLALWQTRNSAELN